MLNNLETCNGVEIKMLIYNTWFSQVSVISYEPKRSAGRKCLLLQRQQMFKLLYSHLVQFEHFQEMYSDKSDI